MKMQILEYCKIIVGISEISMLNIVPFCNNIQINNLNNNLILILSNTNTVIVLHLICIMIYVDSQ